MMKIPAGTFISLLILLSISSCKERLCKTFELNTEQGNVKVQLEKIDRDRYILISNFNGQVDRWKIPYPVFQFEKGDIDADHSDDILIGVIKKTRFDPVIRKRIFIFRLEEGKIRPLWLGSRVGQPLEMFHFNRSDTLTSIVTIEKEKDGKYLLAEYCWKGFGLYFMRYICRETDKKQAYRKINHYEKK